MTETVRYREKAAELRELAAQAENPKIRDELIVLAMQYEHMATVIDARGGGALDPEPS